LVIIAVLVISTSTLTVLSFVCLLSALPSSILQYVFCILPALIRVVVLDCLKARHFVQS